MGGKRIVFILYVVLALALCPTIMAKTGKGHMKLLAVSEADGVMSGSVADLYVEIISGSGRVFIDTFPLTKVDTQISTRFAKEIACDYIEQDCSRYDFIYTIRSGSSIIGGPSAGAAITVLTMSVLEGYDVDESVAITGTINSGGIVGHVGGVKAKVEAAAMQGLTTALIPEGEQLHTEDENTTIDLVKYGEELGIRVVPILDLDLAVYEVTGEITKEKLEDVAIDGSYKDTMKFLAEQLCGRTETLMSNIGPIETNTTEERLNGVAENLTRSAVQAFARDDFYSSASFCFGANIRYNHIDLLQKNHSDEKMLELNTELANQMNVFMESVQIEPISTMTDLEAFMVVTERLHEAQVYTDLVQKSINDNATRVAQEQMAYALERYKSAESWHTFRNQPGKEFIFNDASLSNSCQQKIAEVEERVQYVRFFLPEFFTQERTELKEARDALKNEEYAICLFKASKAKAEADVILSVVGIQESRLDMLLERKLEAVQRIIVQQTARNIFPILGYSYYEYSKSLKESDIQSALLYAEYALELSRMDMYFESESKAFLGKRIDWNTFKVFIVGALLGICSGMLLMFHLLKDARNYTKKKKKVEQQRKNHERLKTLSHTSRMRHGMGKKR